MEEFFSDHRERDLVLSRAPLLKKYLDPLIELDPQKWHDEVSIEFGKVAQEFQSLFGGHVLNLGIWPATLSASLNKVFPPNTDEGNKLGIVATLIAIGYQIGNVPDCAKFNEEIIVRSIVQKAFALPESDEDWDTLGKQVWIMLVTGAYWRRSKNPIPEEKDSPVFKKFIEGNKKFNDLKNNDKDED